MKCSECGKQIEKRPRLFHRITGKRVCKDCCNRCYHSEAWIKNKNDPEAQNGILTYKNEAGLIMLRCGIITFLRKLCSLEEQYQPDFRFTKKNEETEHIECWLFVPLTDMLQRLFEYEHERGCEL